MPPPVEVPGATSRLKMALDEVPGLVRLAVPLIVGLSASTLIGVTDTLMVAPLGTTPLAAVAVTGSILVVFYAAIYGLLSAFGVAVAQAWGARAHRSIPGLVRSGLMVGVLAGLGGSALMGLGWFALPLTGQPPEVLAILAPYWFSLSAMLVPFGVLIILKQLFEGIDRPWIGVAYSFLGVGINVPLNWLLIYGPGPLPALGLTGAGLASLAAEALACAIALAHWRFARSNRRLSLPHPPSRTRIGRLAVEGAPLGLGYIGETAAYAVAALMMGWFGATALAANQVANSIGSLLYMVPLGMAGAVAVRIGQATGAGQTNRLRPIAASALTVVTAWMLAAAALLAVFGDPLARLIVADGDVAALAASIFLVFALMQVADGVQSTSLGALRGLNDTAWPAWVSLGAYWLLALPLGWLLAFPVGWGPVGIWAGFGAGLAVVAVALPVRLWSKTRKTAAAPPADIRSAG
jgi:multidrug resistance protein, MATE family